MKRTESNVTPLRRARQAEPSRWNRAEPAGSYPPAKPRRITAADEETSDELLHIFHNPTQGWWSNRWVVELEDHGVHTEDQDHRTPE